MGQERFIAKGVIAGVIEEIQYVGEGPQYARLTINTITNSAYLQFIDIHADSEVIFDSQRILLLSENLGSRKLVGVRFADIREGIKIDDLGLSEKQIKRSRELFMEHYMKRADWTLLDS